MVVDEDKVIAHTVSQSVSQSVQGDKVSRRRTWGEKEEDKGEYSRGKLREWRETEMGKNRNFGIISGSARI